MANLLKKIQIGNPLINLGLMNLYDQHELAKTDEELAAFYHHMLDSVEGSKVAESFAYSMISYSTGVNINPIMLLLQDHAD